MSPRPNAALPRAVQSAINHTVAMAPEPVFVVSQGTRSLQDGTLQHVALITWANAAAGDALGRESEDLVGMSLDKVLLWSLSSDEITPPSWRREVRDARTLLHDQRSRRQKGHLVRADGAQCEVEIAAYPVPTTELWTVTVTPAVSLAQEANAAQASETAVTAAAAAAYERRFVALAERTPVPTVMSDVGLRLAHANDAFAALVGLPAEAVLGTGWLSTLHEDDASEVMECARRALEGDDADTVARVVDAQGSVRLVHWRLAPVHTPNHGAGFVGTAEDVTERRAFESKLAYQAHHDPLTGLPNRTALTLHLESVYAALQGVAPPPGPTSSIVAGPRRASSDGDIVCLFLDLDNFKMVNDSLGHEAGDALLRDVAQRLQGSVRDGDVITRIGGDEFVVICHGVHGENETKILAERILSVLATPVVIGGVPVHLSGSLGVARSHHQHTSAQDLLRDADIAMYQAKAAGKNQYALCDESARDTARDLLRLVSDLREAIEDRSIELVYQPVVGLLPETTLLPEGEKDSGGWAKEIARSSRLATVEALARWNHPVRGRISPDVFVSLAESHQLIEPLTFLVLDRACAQMAQWRTRYGQRAPQRVNVNLSALQLSDTTLVSRISATLVRHGVPGSSLCLEITESALMRDPGLSRVTLLALRELGVTIAIDDFGTGYSSLAHLQKLPVDYLKIDRSFVAELGTSSGAPVAAAVVSLATALGLKSVAEGVETLEQAEQLRQLGCTFAQGWLYAPGLTPHLMDAWIESLPAPEVPRIPLQSQDNPAPVRLDVVQEVRS